jgi:hypothetical protein
MVPTFENFSSIRSKMRVGRAQLERDLGGGAQRHGQQRESQYRHALTTSKSSDQARYRLRGSA